MSATAPPVEKSEVELPAETATAPPSVPELSPTEIFTPPLVPSNARPVAIDSDPDAPDQLHLRGHQVKLKLDLVHLSTAARET